MTTEIEIYGIEKVKGGYEVEYSTCEADVTLVIGNDTLIEYIETHHLNVIDDDSELVPVTIYLSENYFEVVKSYLETL